MSEAAPGTEDLRERLDAVHAAADRLMREASERIPPRGFEVPESSRPDRDPFSPPELAAVVQLLDSIRAIVPPELAGQVREALRELLMAVRALIDWYLERVERAPSGSAEVQDIPID
jgi:hypothetical protein